jgi:hypothetical protein
MRLGFVAAILLVLTSQAFGDISLAVRLTTEGMVELLFENTGKTRAELDIPFEGSGSCDKYFDVDAELLDGTPARKSMLYAPSIPSFVVTLKPRGRYVHRIKPSAYLNNVEVGGLKKLRITYINPLDGTKTTSIWINAANKPSEATR